MQSTSDAKSMQRRWLTLLSTGTALALAPASGLAATDPAVEAQLKALAQQLQIIQQQSNRQIQALSQQVQALQAQLQAAKASQAQAAIPPQGTVLTKNPGNLEGIAQVPP